MTKVQYIRVFYGSVVAMACVMMFLQNNEEQLIDNGNDPTFRAPKMWFPLQDEDMVIIENINITEISNNGIDVLADSRENLDIYGNSYEDPLQIETMHPAVRITQTELSQEEKKLKKILIWNSAYGSKTLDFGFGHKPFQLVGCEVDTCMTTSNRNLIAVEDFDAILFHFRSLSLKDLPQARSPSQRWLFWEIESTSYVFQDPNIYNNMFNWTFTYKRNSDIVFTYGSAYPKVDENSNSVIETQKNAATDREVELTNNINNKTKMAAWFVSNCRTKSRRERYVKKLQKFIKVDIYGQCGPLKCERVLQDDCYKMVEKEYKFYLSFENSLCPDYVTEKFFNVLKYDVIPVVYGLADYEAIAPPHSYINALHYPNEEALANYLLYLHQNGTAYREYFRWKTSYEITGHWSNTALQFCDLCKKLHNDKEPKVYQHLRSWFMDKEKCMKPKTSNWMEKIQDLALDIGITK